MQITGAADSYMAALKIEPCKYYGAAYCLNSSLKTIQANGAAYCLNSSLQTIQVGELHTASIAACLPANLQ